MSDGADSDRIEAYLASLKTERGYSPHTIDAYRIDLAELVERVQSKAWHELTEADVRRWVARAARAGLAPRSIARRLSSWRGFFDWLSRLGQVSANPARGVRAPRLPKRLPKALSADSARQLADYSPGDRFESIRNKAILELFYSSGLRLSELTSLDDRYAQHDGYRSQSWIDLEQGEATVLGKGNKKRTVPIGAHARRALQAWRTTRAAWLAAHPGADAHALFVSVRGKRLAGRSVQSLIRQLALTQGIPANVHPHVLRHSFASHLLQSSGDLRAVQELLGHASIATTQVYTALDFQRLALVYDAAHPRARRKSA